MSIEVRQVSKRFGSFEALRGIDLAIASGELVALLGPSGSGKTTLLRIIAGLEFPNGGEVFFDGQDAAGLSLRDRRAGFVFQHYALFRHLSVFENVAFGLRVRPRKARPSGAEIKARVGELLDLVQVGDLAARYPAQLSGGQRQRVALARALAVEPRVLLLDEPFGALDARVRQELRRWLRQLHDQIGITSVFVTHDQQEALEVADRVVVMQSGQIEQVGTSDEVYDRPANPFVYRFLGSVNRLVGRVHYGRARFGVLEVAAPEHAEVADAPAFGYVRPHDLALSRHRNGAAALDAIVRQVQVVGPVVRLALQRSDGGDRIDAELSKEAYRVLEPRVGESIVIEPKNLRVFVGTT